MENKEPSLLTKIVNYIVEFITSPFVIIIPMLILVFIMFLNLKEIIEVLNTQYYYSDDYDIEMMANDLNLEPEYIESNSRYKENYISSTKKEDGSYEYHYVIYVSHDELMELSKKYKYDKEDNNKEDDNKDIKTDFIVTPNGLYPVIH